MSFKDLIPLTAVILACLASPMEVAAYKGPVETRAIDRYSFQKYEYEWNGKSGHVLEIWKGNRKLRELRAHDLWIYSLDKQANSFELGVKDKVVVQDLTGDGIKDVIIQSWSGGAHCCYSFDAFSLGNQLHHIWHHDAGNGHLFVKLPKHGMPELLVENDHDYLLNGIGLDQMPIDVYRWSRGKFRLLVRRSGIRQRGRSRSLAK